eukprot:GHUV01030037.1.p1 GENE.GHUV01030037.1~~GHUV01030037.1.p1  ORF type:complete len:102 (-),score=23.64 GHUV01030037.1:54-359(-)
MQIKEDQTMYYLANPDNGKKVEPRDGRYWCEADSRFVDVAGNRYVLTARVADATRECYVNMFNEQVGVNNLLLLAQCSVVTFAASTVRCCTSHCCQHSTVL